MAVKRRDFKIVHRKVIVFCMDMDICQCFYRRGSIIGSFISSVRDAPHVGTIHATVNRIWNSVGKASRIDVQFLSPKTVLFRIDNDQSRARVLKRKYWHIADVPLVVNEWRPETVHDKPSLSAMPLWVDFSGVPGFLFSQKGLRFLADITGDFVRLHPNTERCTRLDMARILVEVNLEKELTEKICVEDKEGKEFLVSVSYPWLPARCNQCLRWGHKFSECSRKGSEGGAVSPQSPVSQAESVTATSNGVFPQADSIAVVAELVTELESVSVTVGVGKQSEEETIANMVSGGVSNVVTVISGNETDKSQSELGEVAGAVLACVEVQETEQGWSVVPPSRHSSPSRMSTSRAELSSKSEMASGSHSGFRVLEDTLEDGEIEVTDAEQAPLGDESSLGEAINPVSGTKTVAKRNGKQKQKRPILNKKDMLQVRPQANSNKTSSRKF